MNPNNNNHGIIENEDCATQGLYAQTKGMGRL